MAEQKEKEKKTCKYYKCGRETWKDDEHCIFHSRNVEEKMVEFKDVFRNEFDRQYKHGKFYNFMGFVFPGDTSFEAIEFEKSANFMYAQFSGKASFWGTKFSDDVDFSQTQFSGEANFEFSQFSGLSIFIDTQFSGEVNFYGSTFSVETLAGIFTSLKNKGIKRILKGRYKIKDFRFHLGEKIAKEYPMIDRMTKDAWYLDDFKNNHPVIYWMWWLFADCGRSMLRWALWSILFAVIFAAIFYSVYQGDTASFRTVHVSETIPVFSFLYYSIVTFTTLGFGDIVPKTDWLQFWVMMEVILGYIMLGGLISILANKLARRS